MYFYNEPALFVDNHIAISDLHLGITRDIFMSGISMPSQVEGLAMRLNKIQKETKIKNLIVNGDFRHNIPTPSFSEKEEIPRFLDLLKYKNIIIVKGNHDGMIEDVINKGEVVKQYETKDYCFSHGHRNIETDKKNIVIGHNHPGIKFRDRFGAIYIQPVWVIGNVRLKSLHKLIIMPPFNELSGKVAVNENQFMGPIAKKIKNPKAILLDGTDLGKIKNVKV